MKRLILLTVILLSLSANAIFAQQRHDDKGRKERFEAFQKSRMDFITKKMKLTESESEAFWPLCNELQMKKFEINKPLRNAIGEIHKKQREKKEIAEVDYKKIIQLTTEIRIKEAELEQEYQNKFMEVIPAAKVFLYQNAEQEFGKQMMEKRNRN
ncbi:hypothetical protein M2138_001917 [Dysgonomonadaceae bacterium PH5-43]|nr:hypothetical protein [Dysgonomonadaceae bacterium PH5-43]